MTPKQKEDLHSQIMKRAADANIADYANRADALEDLQFKAGEQWDLTLKQEREKDGRPVITVNQVPKFVRQITNDARENRPSIKVRGVDDDSDPKTAEVFEGLIRNIEDLSEAVSTAYIPAVDGAASCGIGHWRITTEYADDDVFYQDIFIRGIANPMAVLWDPQAKLPTRADAEWCIVIDDFTDEEYKARWPDAGISDFMVDANVGFWRDEQTKTVRVAEYWCKEDVDKTLGLTQNGKVIDLTNIPAPSIKFLGIKETRKVKAKKVCQYIVSGSEILEGPNEWAGKYIPIVPVIGEEVFVGERRTRYGVVRWMKDPQRLYNYWLSAQAEQIALQPKAPFIGTAKQIEKYKAVWAQANKRNFPYLPYDPDGTAPPPQRSQPPVASSGMSEMLALAANDMKSTTGIYDAALGNRGDSGAKSGVALQSLQKESDTSNLHFADNLALSIRHTGRILIDLIQSIYDTERVVRVLGEDGSGELAKINQAVMTKDGQTFVHDLTTGKYDVTVKVGPSYQTRRMEAADMMLQFIQTVPDSAQFILDLLAKNMDWPGADQIAERFHMLLAKTHPEMVKPDPNEPPPQPTQADQMNALMQQLQVRKAEAEAREAEATAEDSEMDAALKGAQVMQMAVSGPLEMAAQQAVMNVLQRLLGSAQPQMQPAQ